MKLKIAAAIILAVALFPALTTGVAEQLVRGVLQALMALVGGNHA